MAMPMEYAAQQASVGRNKQGWDFLKENAAPAIGAGFDVAAQGLPALLQAYQKQNISGPVQGPLNKPKPGISLEQDRQNQMNDMNSLAKPSGMSQLADVLQGLIGHRTDRMIGNINQPTNPQRWQQRASQAVDQTNGQAQPPMWNGNTPGFSFNQYFSENNPLSALGDEVSGSAQAAQPENKSFLRKAANVAGNIGSKVAGALPAIGGIAGSVVPGLGTLAGTGIGMAAGGGLAALSHLGQNA